MINHYHGNDPAAWRTNVRAYSRVRYAGVYDGIDLVYYGNQQRLEYDFEVAPGRDPNAIRLRFDGAARVEIDEATGDLLLHVGNARGAGGSAAAPAQADHLSADRRRRAARSRAATSFIPTTRSASWSAPTIARRR